MIHSLSVSLSRYLSSRLNYSSERESWLIYGFEVVLGKIINYSIILLFSLGMGCFWKAVLFLAIFTVLRKYTGGFHASKEWVCTTASLAICVLTLHGTSVFSWRTSIIFTLISIAISFVIINLFAPVNHPNMRLDRTEMGVLRKRARFTHVIFVGGIIALMYFEKSLQYAVIASSAVLCVSILVVVSKLLKQEVIINEGSDEE